MEKIAATPKLNLSAIKAGRIPVGTSARQNAIADLKRERLAYENEQKRLANDHAELENRELSDRLSQRKSYARWTFVLVAVWMTCVLGLLIVQGLGGFSNRLTEKVLMVAVGSTTINVLGMLAIILHGVYPDAAKTVAGGAR